LAGEAEPKSLPNSGGAFVEPEKLTEYLLNPDHPVGGDKAAFLYRFGFRVFAWQVLRVALITHARSARVVTVRATPYGTHYTIEGQLETPDARNPLVRTVWSIDNNDRRPRFLTAFPGRRGGRNS
jgi:hypothetical protein